MPSRKKPRRAGYHHGNLRPVLIAAALELIEEVGFENVTVRETARRAGVSSGAPFRHFPNRTALLTAIAEEAMRRLRVEVEAARERSAARPPIERLRALGRAYFRWLDDNPTLFQLISARRLIDFDGSEALTRDNEMIQAWMKELLAAARSDLRPGEHATLLLAMRGLAYGLGRMLIDGHLPQWGVAAGAERRAMEAALDLLIDRLT